MEATQSTLKIINTRQSLRVFDQQKKISEQTKNIILDAAISSPTAGALMMYSIIEIQDQETKNVLSVSCDKQPFIAKAPLVLVFAADYNRLYSSWLKQGKKPSRKPSVGDFMLACNDAIIAAQSAVIAAQALGIGSCYIGDIIENAPLHKKLLALPNYVFPATMLCFGYPVKQEKRPKVLRLPRKYIVHKNTYNAQLDFSNDEQLKQIWEQRSEKGFRKFEADFSVEMTKSMKIWLADWE